MALTRYQIVRFHSSFRKESHLRGKVRPGLSALSGNDLGLIARQERKKVGDSLDLDAAAKEQFPQENRWDYLISVASASQLIGIEPHSARDDEVRAMIAKKRWAVQYLREHLIAGHIVRKWLWVSHGSVRFSNTEKKRRLLDQEGIKFVGRTLQSLS